MKKRRKTRSISKTQLKLTYFFPKSPPKIIKVKEPSKLDILAKKIAKLVVEEIKQYFFSPKIEMKEITIRSISKPVSKPSFPKPEYLQELKQNELFRKRRELVDNI